MVRALALGVGSALLLLLVPGIRKVLQLGPLTGATLACGLGTSCLAGALLWRRKGR